MYSFQIILTYIFCSFISTSLQYKFQIQQDASKNLTHNFYFCRLPGLRNLLPFIDISLSVSTFESKLKRFIWTHFTSNLHDITTPAHFTIIAPVKDTFIYISQQPSEQFSN